MMRELAMATVITLLWPAAAAVSLAVGVRGAMVSSDGTLLLAISTAGAYAFDRLRDGGNEPRVARLLGYSVLVTGLGSLSILTMEPWRIGVTLLLALFALSYIPLKRTIPKNVLATLAWTIAVAILPAAGLPNFDGEYLPAALAVAGIMFANTTLCDLTTIEEDRRRGVRSMSVCYGVRAARSAAATAALLGVGIAISGDRIGLAVTAGVHALIAIAKIPSPRVAADLALLLAGPIAMIK